MNSSSPYSPYSPDTAAVTEALPAPVPLTPPGEDHGPFPDQPAEVQANDAKIKQLGKESGEKVAQNVIMGTVGVVVFFPALFLMDFQGTAGKEVVALQSRQQYLATMAEQRCGAVVPLPVQNIPPAPAAPAPVVSWRDRCS